MLLIAQLEQCWRGGLDPSNLVQYCLGEALFLLRPPWLPSCPFALTPGGTLKASESVPSFCVTSCPTQ